MDLYADIMSRMQEIMSDKTFINSAIENAANSESFKETMREIIKDSLNDQDVVVVINEQCPEPEPGILTVENGIRVFAVIGTAYTVYQGYVYGNKLLNKLKR